MDLSYSSISTFKNCRRKFKFSQLDLLKPKKEDSSTSVGSIIHKAFEKYFLGGSIQDCSAFICKTFDDLIASAQNPWESEDLLVDKYIALGMWNFYPFQRSQFKKVIPEQKFRVRIPGFKSVYLVGFLDGLVQEDRPMIREVKTTGLSMQQMKDRASTAAQGDSYVWAITRLLHEKIHGVWYDVIRKPLCKKNKSEDAQGFAERNYKVYEEARTPQDMDKLYATFPVWKTEYRLLQFEEDLVKDVREIMRAIKKDYLQRNTDACQMYNRECPYKKICFFEGEPDQDMIDSFYTKRGVHEEKPDTLVKGCKNPLAS